MHGATSRDLLPLSMQHPRPRATRAPRAGPRTPSARPHPVVCEGELLGSAQHDERLGRSFANVKVAYAEKAGSIPHAPERSADLARGGDCRGAPAAASRGGRRGSVPCWCTAIRGLSYRPPHALRVADGGRAVATFSLVAQARDPPLAERSRQAPAERASRAHASKRDEALGHQPPVVLRSLEAASSRPELGARRSMASPAGTGALASALGSLPSEPPSPRMPVAIVSSTHLGG